MCREAGASSDSAYATGTAVSLGTGVVGLAVARPVGAVVGAMAGAVASGLVHALRARAATAAQE